MEEEKIGNNQ